MTEPVDPIPVLLEQADAARTYCGSSEIARILKQLASALQRARDNKEELEQRRQDFEAGWERAAERFRHRAAWQADLTDTMDADCDAYLTTPQGAEDA